METRIFMTHEGFYADRSKPLVEDDEVFEECDPVKVVAELEAQIKEADEYLSLPILERIDPLIAWVIRCARAALQGVEPT